MSSAIEQLIRCAASQARHGATIVACALCGDPTPEPYRNGPAVCATCCVRRQAATA